MDQNQKEIIEKRVEARKQATELIEFAKQHELKEEDEIQAYWRQIEILAVAAQGGPKREEGPGIQPMSESQSKAFDDEVIPFGCFKGEKIKDIRLSYLQRLTEPSVFIRDLKRYLLSERIKRELEQESNED